MSVMAASVAIAPMLEEMLPLVEWLQARSQQRMTWKSGIGQ